MVCLLFFRLSFKSFLTERTVEWRRKRITFSLAWNTESNGGGGRGEKGGNLILLLFAGDAYKHVTFHHLQGWTTPPNNVPSRGNFTYNNVHCAFCLRQYLQLNLLYLGINHRYKIPIFIIIPCDIFIGIVYYKWDHGNTITINGFNI